MRQWRTETPYGFFYSSEAELPEGLLLVIDTFAYVHDECENAVAAILTTREATLDGEPVFYPRSAELAAKAGLAAAEVGLS